MKKTITILSIQNSNISALILLVSLLLSFNLNAQVFWTENFNNGCAGNGAACGGINAYVGGLNGPWTSTLGPGNFGTDPNTFYVSCTENGNPVGVAGSSCGGATAGGCGTASATNSTLHVANISTSPAAGLFCPTGDCGAAYDAGLFGGAVETDIRAESPTINCTGKVGITLDFHYMLGGQLGIDYGFVEYSDNNGATWNFLASPNITAVCGGQGVWTAYSFALPASCDNNPTVKIGFHWLNDDDGTGSDPSYAIDDVTLSAPVSGNTITTGVVTGPFCACSTINVPFTSTGTFTAGNIYKAELSDALGSFGAPVVIGQIISTANAGVIACTIPCNTPAGTNYLIQVVSSNPVVTGSSNGVNITINAVQDATFTYASSSYCQAGTNPSAVITGVAGGTFTAVPAGLVFSNASTGLINVATSAINTYTITYTTPGPCPGTSTASISITGTPVATFSYIPSVYCQNATNPLPTFSGGGVGGTFSATPAGLVFVSTGTGEVDLAASTPNTYTVTNTINGIGGCPSANATSTITINPVQDATFAYSTTTFCQSGTNPVPTITGTAGGTFTSAPAGLVFVSTSTGEINLAGSTLNTYTITYTTPGPCAANSSVTINITLAPVATFSYTASPYCQSSPNPSPTYSGGGSAGTFTATPAGLTFVSSITGQVDLVNSVPGTYTVTNTIAASGGCTAATATSTITITASSIATFSYIGTPYCTGGTNPSPTIAFGGVAGTFTSTAGLSIVSTTGAVDLSLTTPGTYTVTNTVTNAGCPNSVATSTIQIIAAQVATFSYPNTPYCQSAGTASPTLVGTAGTFTASPAGLTINASTGVVTLSSTPGTYTVTNTIAGTASCPNPVVATTTITITAGPIVTVNSGTICAGATFNFTAVGATTYTWSAGATSTGGATAVASPVVTTSYTVTGTTAGCSNTAVSTVTISPPLPVTVTSPTICSGQTATLTAGGATTYTWSAGATGVGNTATTAALVTTTSYTVTGTTAGCSNTAVSVVTVQVCNPPVPVFSGTPLVICNSGCVTFTDASLNNPTSWLWQFPGGVPASSNSQNPGQVCYSAIGQYPVILTVSNATGDSTLTMVNYVSIVNPIPVHITSDHFSVNSCESTNLTAMPPGTAYQWGSWLGAITCETCQTATVSPQVTEQYWVNYTDVNGCTSTDTATVTVTKVYTYFMPTGFSPNDDNFNDQVIVYGRGISYINLKIFDRIGEKVFETSDIAFDAEKGYDVSQGWDGRLHGIMMNENSFVYELSVTYCNGQTVKENGSLSLVK